MATSEDDFDLVEAWEQACAKFAKTVQNKCDLGNVDLKKGPSSNLSPQEVLDRIAASKAKDEERKEKYRTARKVLDKTLNAVQLLGGIASQAASSAFPASGMCWNAVSYLISAGQNYSKIFTSLDDLFSRSSEMLERVVVYLKMDKRDLDLALRKIIFRLLLSFTSICELSIVVLHENRLKKLFKVVLFNDDEGVAGEFEKLRNLCDNELQMKGTLTYQSVKASERRIVAQGETLESIHSDVAQISSTNREGFKSINSTLDKLEKAQRERESDKITRAQRDQVEKVLGEDKSKLERQTFDTIKNSKVDKTGSWIEKERWYQDWADIQQPGSSLLMLTGKEGFGKSYLTVNVIQDLEKRQAQAHDLHLRRTQIAYIFFGRGKSENRIDFAKDSRPVAAALISVIWQLCDDIVFLKEFASSLDDTNRFEANDNDQVLSLFSQVLEVLRKTDTTCFIVLDGIDQLDENREAGKNLQLIAQMVNLVDADQRTVKLEQPTGELPTDKELTIQPRAEPSTRLFGTSIPNILDQLSVGLPMQTLDLSKSNAGDIEAYIENRMNDMSILKGKTQDISELKALILDQLVEIVNGDFKNLEMLLDQIASKQRPSEIRETLEMAKTGDTRTDTISREIQRLNDSLSDEDIRDLNELLLWVLGTIRTLRADELEAALFNQNGEANFTPVYNRITSKFSVLFTASIEDDVNPVDENYSIALKSDSHKEYFTKISEEQAKERGSSGGGALFASEIRLMKKFLHSVCDDDLYEKFGFDDFFQRKSSPENVISVNTEDEQIQILERVLRVVHNPADALEALRPYAISYFPDHLVAVDLSLSDPIEKGRVGKLLVPLFTDISLVPKWWPSDPNLQLMRRYWLCDQWEGDTYFNDIVSWFKDTAVLRQLDDATRDAAKQLIANNKTAVEVLENVAKHMASAWLSGDWNQGDPAPFAFLYCYLSKQKRLKNPEDGFDLNDDHDPAPTVANILECKEWALKQPERKQDDCEALRNVARTLRDYQHHDEAIEQFKLATTMIENNWMILAGLGDTYCGQEDWPKALEMFKSVAEKIKSGQAQKYNDQDPQDYLPMELQTLGKCYSKTDQPEKAIELYRESLSHNRNDWSLMLEIMKVFKQQNKFTDIIKFMEELEHDQDEDRGVSRLLEIFWALCYDDEYHEAITQAARRADSVDYINQKYNAAVQSARTLPQMQNNYYNPRAMLQILGNLLYYQGCFYFEHPFSPENEKKAIESWEEIHLLCHSHPQGSALSGIRGYTVKKLCGAYIGMAKEEQYDSPAAHACLEKIEELASDEDFGGTSTTDVHLLLCRYFSLMGQHDYARQIVKGHMKAAFDLLSNDDPSDDWQGFSKLGITLNYLADDVNALAAFSLITPFYINAMAQEQPTSDENKQEEPTDTTQNDSKEDSKSQAEVEGKQNSTEEENKEDQAVAGQQETSSGETPETKEVAEATKSDEVEKSEQPDAGDENPKPDETPEVTNTNFLENYGYSCDGLACQVTWQYMSDIYHCKDCLDMAFCTEHMHLIKDEKRRYGTCKDSHTFLHVPQYDDEATKKIGKDNVKVGETVIPITDWLSALRKDWGM